MSQIDVRCGIRPGIERIWKLTSLSVWLLELWTCWETLASDQSLSFDFLGSEITTPSLQSLCENIGKAALWEAHSGPELVQLMIVSINMNTHPLAHWILTEAWCL